ncbi:histidine phosphatase family protein [Lentilactobacillus buchneri]|uniref:Phosphoglycerate mutase n=1 Tax=Lentilactobacillus buchneri subsp. silagei CD034 TaxID=1071400 RepID=J9W1P2_LENBU|nr:MULTISPECIES: phosphoglycerate mutase family protein [Lentilactobacillus]MCC6101340.1 histidine phosphatase family protein [Lactobacillus sp.]AFR99626.1 phosphoglycerate mutase [Lentilactobacillus buchneri subsp. silagei CD034]MCT2901537.1 phosphoglycerate mutase family protein [Lentilactobacillus buchneri]MCT3543215.1 phosphoglycerate mutase family protein [Lentilactobacillus buchneri]MCT3544166.1 phosphoglycerate mutase family protein [Lentilactobacillus buchneri]
MSKFNLYMVRHGQTYFNIYNKLQGWSNSPLTEKGIQNAVDTGEKLKDTKFAAAYCSDTTRAEQTAQTILDENDASDIDAPITSMFFREEFYGYFEGNDMSQAWYLAGAPHGLPTFRDIVEKYSIGKAKDYLKEADPFHQAENNQEYWKRLDQGFDLIKQNPEIKDGDNVLLISHGNTLLSVVERYGNGQFDVTERPANGSLTKLTVDGDDIHVVAFNQQ